LHLGGNTCVLHHIQKQFPRILTLEVRGWRKSFLNLVSLFSALSFFIGISLSIFKTPRRIAAALVFLRGVLVSFMALVSRYWFSYILFLVYVGGLLVIFIYVCLVRRNFPFKLNPRRGVFGIGLSVLLVLSLGSPEVKSFIGFSSRSSGSDLLRDTNLSLFLGLTILLLVILLVVVRRRGVGSLKIDS